MESLLRGVVREDKFKGSFAVVIGASRAIGLELAKQIAQNGFDLLVVRDSPKSLRPPKIYGRMASRSRRLRSTSPIPQAWRSLPNDSENRATCRCDRAQCRGWLRRRRARNALQADMNVIHEYQVDSSPLKMVLNDMVQRGQGRVLFTSSIAATMPMTF